MQYIFNENYSVLLVYGKAEPIHGSGSIMQVRRALGETTLVELSKLFYPSTAGNPASFIIIYQTY